jgi:SAM-dependent methyltransferase
MNPSISRKSPSRSPRQALQAVIVRQFANPHGALGRLAGFIMAHRPSNRERNAWTVELLALAPGHRVLEFGFGPGLALQACARRVKTGYVVGVDRSPAMVARARSRIAAAIARGRAEVRCGTLADVAAAPGEHGRFDRVFSLNVVQFLPDIEAGFRQIRDLLAPGGMVATTFQPRLRNPTRNDALRMAERIGTAMRAAGFTGITRHELPLEPVPAVCVTGSLPARSTVTETRYAA